jgi:hypothetical protein
VPTCFFFARWLIDFVGVIFSLFLADMLVANNTVFFGGGQASHLTLPLVDPSSVPATDLAVAYAAARQALFA